MKTTRPVLFLNLQNVICRKQNDKVIWMDNIFKSLNRISDEGDYIFSLLTESSKENNSYILDTLEGEGIKFEEIPKDYNNENSLAICSSLDEFKVAAFLKVKAISFNSSIDNDKILQSNDWLEIASFILDDKFNRRKRIACVTRKTKETSIQLKLDLDSRTHGKIETKIGFFDHMLEQFVKHAHLNVELKAEGDLEVDEHHTVEDVAIVLGEAFKEALNDKRGINRYGFFILPMDEVLAQVTLDFSGRPYLVWDVNIKREYIGNFPVELFEHFFRSFCYSSGCTLNISVSEGNAHHQIEAIFKAFSKAIAQAIRRYPYNNEISSTKGVL